MDRTRIELVIRIGEEFKEHRVPVTVSSDLLRELSEPMELSDDPIALVLASPGLYGGFGDAVTIRKKMFEIRKSTAQEISERVTASLVSYFGRDDKINGYAKEPKPTNSQVTD